jgi:putative ABC transport system ATP-binding protein
MGGIDLLQACPQSVVRPTIIELRNITKHFGEGDLRVVAVDDVSLRIEAGDFAVMVGPSGSGKTTLLNIIAGLERPSAGEVLIEGEALIGLSDSALSKWRARHLGLMFQSHNLIPVLDSRQNVELPLILRSMPRAERKARAIEALAKVGLAERAHHRPDQLSLGEQQRVAMARAFVHEPSLVILDEPTGNLDRRTADEVLALLKSLNEELGTTVVMVTHDLKATEHATRLVELDKGVLR